MENENNKLGLMVMVNTSCNMRCSYCFIKNKATEIKTDFSDLKKSLIHNPNITFLTLMGGEPLMNKEIIIDFLQFIRSENILREDNKIGLAILTNGTYYIQELKDYKDVINSVQISLDGSKEVHDENRVFLSNNGTYDIVKENIFKYFDDGINISIHSVITNTKKWSKNILNVINFFPKQLQYSIALREFQKGSFIKTILDVFRIIKVEEKIRKMNRGFSFSFKLFFNDGVSVCPGGTTLLSVDLKNGNLFPCEGMTEDTEYNKYNVGSIKNGSFVVDEKKLNEVSAFCVSSNYRINKVPRFFSNMIMKNINHQICYMDNKFTTGNYFVIPFKYVVTNFIIKHFRRIK